MTRMAVLLLAITVFALALSCGGGKAPIIQPPPPIDRDVSGVVTDSFGNPVPGLSILLDGAPTGVVTGANGTFTVPRGKFEFGANQPYRLGVGKGGVVFSDSLFTPANTPSVEIRFAAAGGEQGVLKGSVYNQSIGTPVAGVLLIAFAYEGGLFFTESSGSGEYEMNLPAGMWLLLAWKDEYNPNVVTVEVQGGGESYQDVYLSPVGPPKPPDGIAVSGTITDSKTGSPVEGALVTMTVDTGILWGEVDGKPVPSLGDSGGSSSGGAGGREPAQSDGMSMPYFPSYQETHTDAAGHYLFEDDAVGYSAYITANAESYMPKNTWQDLSGAESEIAVDLTIDPLVLTTVSGRAVDGEGDPVSGAWIEFIYQGEYGGGGGWIMPMEDGTEPAMRDWVESTNDAASESGGGGAMGAPAPTAGEQGGNDGFDNPMMMKYLYEQRQQRESSQAEPMPPDYFVGYYSVQSDENGEFTIDNIAAGPYIVFANAYRHLPFSGSTEVADDGSTTVDVVLDEVPVGSVEGDVTDDDGNPIPDVLINCVQPNQDPFTFTDSAGHYRIDNIPTGVWIVGAYAVGYQAETVEVIISEDHVLGISFSLDEYTPPQVDTVYFTGTVLDGTTGEPVEGARLYVVSGDNQYWDDAVTDGEGVFTMNLVPTDYSIDIDLDGFQNLFTRFWVDPGFPQMEFYMWPIGAPMGGGWGGISVPGNPGPPTGGGEEEPGGGETPPGEPTEPPIPL